MNNEKTHRDLSNNNKVRALLEERKILNDSFDERRGRWKQINDELKELMGDATVATLPGWRLEIRTQNWKERIIPAKTLSVLFVKGDGDDEE